jgi:hypothetical protein
MQNVGVVASEYLEILTALLGSNVENFEVGGFGPEPRKDAAIFDRSSTDFEISAVVGDACSLVRLIFAQSCGSRRVAKLSTDLVEGRSGLAQELISASHR